MPGTICFLVCQASRYVLTTHYHGSVRVVQHPKIAHERENGIGKRGRLVLLEEEMAHPRKAVYEGTTREGMRYISVTRA